MTERSTLRDSKAKTFAFYQANALQYFESTKRLDLGRAYGRFLKHLPVNARLLDAGSGSGRDTLFFLQQGHHVDAFDLSPALAALSTEYTGVRTQVMDLSSLNRLEVYDGVWACASLLHLPRLDLPNVLTRISHALKQDGILYASFRHGARETVSDDGRTFTDMNSEFAAAALSSVSELTLLETWIDLGPGAEGKDLEWFNLLCQKHVRR